ncbi:interleukin-15 isoform X2 [Bufo gargarizans]|uniref:interleukin-15 isoform X2 n=1 Tax=Bufo bufo TaxID=8384 RepID=UPI001ABE8C6A|nr:interleukin-15 isoform X2 [Bufo bufo]XP_044156607.1 interleukin-15 isoform X2 [Bufo gargarizans]
MNLWIPVIFSITLMQSFESKRDKERGTLIRKELDMLKKKLESSKNWKSKYERDLRLYTAKIDEYTDTCTQTIFDCYCEEFKVVVEEISMTEEENVAKGIRHTLNNMLTYRPSESDMIGSCKKCEEYEEKSFQEFLNSFQSITQKMNVK